ncbi:MAG: quinolinate synthase NadA [Thermoguttaceae bacterium]
MRSRPASVEPKHDFASYQSLASDELSSRIRRVKAELGPRLLILGHHYQQDEVIELADLRGDSYGLSQLAANNESCQAIVFCGVHFMAETADILANRPERLAERGGQRVTVVLPDAAAGCSLADMADLGQVERCWQELGEVIDTADLMPITYVNSAAALKAFCGQRGGLVCTSSNARAALDWAFQRRRRVLFFPDQHLGRNTARAMGIPLDAMPLWDPRLEPLGGAAPEAIRQSRVILWNGYCSVHQTFRPEHVMRFRQKFPDIKIMVHPECTREVVELADLAGSTSKMIETVEKSPPGTRWAIGTELHMVNRLRREHPEQDIHLLSAAACMCTTMFRIDLPHLCWAVENLAAGTPVNVIEVEPATAAGALEALQRMLEVR